MNKPTTPARTSRGSNPSSRSVKLFISYSHQDWRWKDQLKTILNGFRYDDRLRDYQVDILESWDDSRIRPGQHSHQAIQNELNEMNIFIPIVTSQFFGSDYIQTIELPRAKERYEHERIVITPILAEEVALARKSEFLHSFQPLPMHNQWWFNYRPKSRAHRLIDDGLWAAIHQVLTGPQSGAAFS